MFVSSCHLTRGGGRGIIEQGEICGYGGIGRRVGFRFQCRKACRFKSCYPHYFEELTTSVVGSFFTFKRYMIGPDLVRMHDRRI